MREILEISSDSSDSIILPTQETENKTRNHVKYVLSDSSDDELLKPITKKTSDSSISSGTSETVLLMKQLMEKYKDTELKNKPAPEKHSNSKKEERELKRLEKISKSEELQREKQLKAAQKAVERNSKPDQCIKLITANLDDNLLKGQFGDKIIEILQTNEVNYKISSQLLSNLITYTRTVQTVDNGTIKTNEIIENHAVLILDLETFLIHIQENTLLKLFTKQQMIVLVYKLDSYLNFVDKLKNDQLHSELGSPRRKKRKEFAKLPIISRETIDKALINVQLFQQIHYLTAETPDDVANSVFQCTNAVSQIPYKQKKLEKYETEMEFYDGVNKNCIQVDSRGNGLGQLWKQALTMFPLARLESAEAICAVYPSPKALYQAYKNCKTIEEAERLLENIQIRRSAGPLTNSRHIGRELSEKIYKVFCSETNETI